MKPKAIVRGHSVSFRVVAGGRPLTEAILEALASMEDAGVPLGSEWKMAYRRGGKVNNGDPYVEADFITVDATWAEQS
jgi:hypothetical protein